MRRLVRLPVLVVLAVFLAAACSSDSDDGGDDATEATEAPADDATDATDAPADDEAEAESAAKACSLITAEEAGEALGGTGAWEAVGSDEVSESCAFSLDDLSASLQMVLYTYPPADAKTFFDGSKSAAIDSGNGEELAGLGEDAYFNSAGFQVVVFAGDAYFSLSSGAEIDQDVLVDLAGKALERIG